MRHTYKILAPGSSSRSRPNLICPYLRRNISHRTIQYIWRLPFKLAKPPSQHIVNVRYVYVVREMSSHSGVPVRCRSPKHDNNWLIQSTPLQTRSANNPSDVCSTYLSPASCHDLLPFKHAASPCSTSWRLGPATSRRWAIPRIMNNVRPQRRAACVRDSLSRNASGTWHTPRF